MEQKKIKDNNISLYSIFVGFLIKNGNKIVAKATLEETLSSVSKRIDKKKHTILLDLFLELNTFVETKRVKIRRRSYAVPFPLSLKRRSYLVTKWVFQIVKENKDNVSLTNKLSTEIIEILDKSKSKALNLKKVNNAEAYINRSNSHFRW